MEIEQESYRQIPVDFYIGTLIKHLWILSRPISIDFCIGVLIKNIWKLSRRDTNLFPLTFVLEFLLTHMEIEQESYR